MPDYALAISEAEITRYRFMAGRAVVDERDLLTQAGVVPGATVADVGCGPAAMAVEIAQIVGDGGRVIAVERDPASLDAARQVVASAGVGNVELRPGDATDTGIGPESVDVALMRHVLAHNGGREQDIVDHLAALVRPGGSVYLVDTDITAIRQVDEEPDLDDQVERYVEFQRRQGNDISVGLRLGQLLRAAGLTLEARRSTYNVVEFRPGMRSPAWAARDAMLAAGAIDESVVTRWGNAYARKDVAPDVATLFMPIHVAIGRRTA